MSFPFEAVRRRALAGSISDTERAALEAGSVWLEGELFNGHPRLERFLTAAYPTLSPRERAFLDGPVTEACAMVEPWELESAGELPVPVWAFLRRQGFFGLGLPEEHGGKGFSALALSAVFAKLASRSLPLSAVVLIPNSVGPGELLLAYGTEEQKSFYLPRLARGDEIPCFALTEPEAGSDAASLSSSGHVYRGSDGNPWLRLDWNKRYITLAPVATLIGLAVRLSDPDELLGRGRDPGITVVLVPASTPGVELGQRHDPMGVPFPNGPTRGRNVELPAAQILGGPSRAGQGWRMLVEALSAGRAVSLPAQSVGGAKKAARVAGAYAAVRRQFGQPIARFEGVEEKLAELAGWTWLLDAARIFTCGALEEGARPAVVSALMKVQTTERARLLAGHAMDILGGAGVCRGPRNLLADAWAGVPIGITVEGANTLTRTLIVFGQGLIRCHPYARRELDALSQGAEARFWRAAIGHAGFLLGNLLRLAVRELSRGRLVRTPNGGREARHWRRLSWASTRFAVLADLALLAHGGQLKRKERLSGRFSDALTALYFAAAALRRFAADGRREEDRPLLDWSLARCLSDAQAAFEAIAAELPLPLIGRFLRAPLGLWLRANRLSTPPSDALSARIAAVLTRPSEQRDWVLAGDHVPSDPSQPHARLERALEFVTRASPLEARLRGAVAAGSIRATTFAAQLEEALGSRLLTAEEAQCLRDAATIRREVIEVDTFAELPRWRRPEGNV